MIDLANLTPEQQELLQLLQKQADDRMAEQLRADQANKVRNYRILNRTAKKGAVLFTGSSLMEQFPVCELARSAGIGRTIYNRGIGGTTTDDFLREIDTVLLDLEPSVVFINIGTNDMTNRVYGDGWMDHLEANYERILQAAKARIPGAKIYCMAYYPTNRHLPSQAEWQRVMLKDRTRENIAECNRRVKNLAEKYGYCYIDANAGLTDENGEQKAEFAIDGVHMYASAYEIVFENLRKYLE